MGSLGRLMNITKMDPGIFLLQPPTTWYSAHVHEEKASNCFCWENNLRDKCPVYSHLPSLGVCVCFCRQCRALSLLTPYTQGATLVTEGLSELSPNSFWKRCIIRRGGLLSWLRQAGTWLPNQFAPPSRGPLFSYRARKQALKRKAIWQY